MNTLLSLAILIFTGMLFGRLAKLVKLPNVTGYLIGGLIVSPNILGIIPADSISNLTIISNVALGFIAFSIGSEFKISYFKRVGITPIVIATLESLLAVVFVVAGMLIAGFELSFALVLGSIAAATAPAATIMVIKQYKAKGPVTETLLSVVAIDDATALIFFGICVAIANALGGHAGSVASSIIKPIFEIFGAIIVGLLLGFIFMLPLKWFKKEGNRMSLIVGFVFLAVGIAETLGLSSLLLCMAMGAALTNLSSETSSIMRLCDSITPPIFLLFFVTSGAELQLSVLPQIGLVGAIYIIMRIIGKVAGASLGGIICKANSNIKKYLGLALIPQAGVAIGLSLIATEAVPQYGMQIRATILCATLIYEIIGPALSKLSLKMSNEIAD